MIQAKRVATNKVRKRRRGRAQAGAGIPQGRPAVSVREIGAGARHVPVLGMGRARTARGPSPGASRPLPARPLRRGAGASVAWAAVAPRGYEDQETHSVAPSSDGAPYASGRSSYGWVSTSRMASTAG